MGLPESRGQISRAIKDLRAQWSATKETWSDANSDRFEKEMLEPMEWELRAAANAMEQMSSLLSQIRSQCD